MLSAWYLFIPAIHPIHPTPIPTLLPLGSISILFCDPISLNNSSECTDLIFLGKSCHFGVNDCCLGVNWLWSSIVMASEELMQAAGSQRYFPVQPEPSLSSFPSFWQGSTEPTRIFDELPAAMIVSVSRPDAGDISPMLLSYTIEFQYKQVPFAPYNCCCDLLCYRWFFIGNCVLVASELWQLWLVPISLSSIGMLNHLIYCSGCGYQCWSVDEIFESCQTRLLSFAVLIASGASDWS